MAIWSVVALAVTLAFLVYRHQPNMMKYLPPWLWPTVGAGAQEESTHNKTTTAELGEGETKRCGVQTTTEESSDAETTPKASASNANGVVPSFSLSAEDADQDETDSLREPTVPSFPVANSAQRASAMPPPSKPTLAPPQKATSSLMPPPARPAPAPAPRGLTPSSAAALRVPSTGPLPNRGLPAGSQQRVSSSLSPKTTVATPSSRGKVLLKPGHSPMDWAALIRSPSSNLSGVNTFQRVTPSQLRAMTGRKGKPAWSSWQGKVYNISPYVDFHPGGGPEIMKAAGRDGEKLFMETHPWVNWENMLGACLVGVMVPEGYHDRAAAGQEESELEGLD